MSPGSHLPQEEGVAEAARTGQPTLPGVAAVRARIKPPPKDQVLALAVDRPVARVLVDVALAHLDRPFDYAVPETMDADARPGVRVKVRFAGKEVGGYLLERTATTEHVGRLQPLRRVVSAEPVLTPEVALLSDAVARRYAGTRADVFRLAVPPRHARTEKESRPLDPVPTPPGEPDPKSWRPYRGGAEYLAHLGRAVLGVLPGDDWAELLAEAVLAADHRGCGVLVCVPDHRDLDRLDTRLTERLGTAERHVVLRADAGPARRYRAFLALSRGERRIAIGTRAAAFAPVPDLGLVVMWDDGDDLYDEPRAPYPHAREVLLLRAEQAGAAALFGAHARSVEAEYLLRTGWATEIAADRATLRQRVQVAATGDDRALARDPAARSARLPHEALGLVRESLPEGPVLVQAPRSGYATRLACVDCRAPAQCAQCHGPLRQRGPSRIPECAWCAEPAAGWTCAECGARQLRAPVLGDLRTAEELGRAFPGVTVRTSSGEHILDRVKDQSAIVVATPGAEPPAARGYPAVLLLDTWLLLARSDLRAAEEAVRRWCNAAGLVRPGGRVLLVGDGAHPAVQAMVRWDPAALARREIEERHSAHLPPASRVATLAGEPADVAAAVAALTLPAGAEVLGPVPAEAETERFVVRVPRVAGSALSDALGRLQAERSAHKLPHVRVEVDPATLG